MGLMGCAVSDSHTDLELDTAAGRVWSGNPSPVSLGSLYWSQLALSDSPAHHCPGSSLPRGWSSLAPLLLNESSEDTAAEEAGGRQGN